MVRNVILSVIIEYVKVWELDIIVQFFLIYGGQHRWKKIDKKNIDTVNIL